MKLYLGQLLVNLGNGLIPFLPSLGLRLREKGEDVIFRATLENFWEDDRKD